MQKKGRIVWILLCFVFLIWFAWAVTRERSHEPVYEGHAVGYWLQHHDLKLHGMDSNAVPTLIEALDTRDGFWNRIYLNIWPSLPRILRRHLPGPVCDMNTRIAAAYVLSALRDSARPAIPALIHTLKTDDEAVLRVDAANALVAIDRGDERIKQALKEAMKDKDASVRATAVWGLSEIDKDGALSRNNSIRPQMKAGKPL
jgi:hypothetical protein